MPKMKTTQDLVNQLTPDAEDEVVRLIQKRKEERKRKAASAIEPVKTPVFSETIGLVEEYVKQIIEEGTADEDCKHYIFESAVTAVYGRDAFKKLRPFYR